jgi:hypothetical protein
MVIIGIVLTRIAMVGIIDKKGLSNIFMKYGHGYGRPLQQFDKYQTRTVNIKQFLLQR